MRDMMYSHVSSVLFSASLSCCMHVYILVPASELKVLVFDPAHEPPPKRLARARPPSAVMTNAVVAAQMTAATNTVAGTNAVAAAKPKFSKQQITGRLRQLKLLFEEGLLTDDFYDLKVAECEAGQ